VYVPTLWTELSALIDRLPAGPARIYADANVPAGLVGFMRERLGWDVFFVVEHEELRRAPDAEHYRLARRMHRTLVTLDRDYLDDRRFPPGESGGVVFLSAPDEQQLARLLRQLARGRLRPDPASPGSPPLVGQKIEVYPEVQPARARRRRGRT
jgi:hypothetical protein